jgi:hypothetical protein
VLALVAEAFVPERLEDDLDLLLEQLAVGLLVLHRRAEGLHLARVIAAADAEHRAALRQDVGDGVVLGQPQRVPHRRDVEAATDAQLLRRMRQMHRHHQQVRDALVAFVLEVVLGQPQRVPAHGVHPARHRFGLLEDRGELLVGIAPLVGRRRVLAHVAEVDMPGIDRRELVDHGVHSFRGHRL